MKFSQFKRIYSFTSLLYTMVDSWEVLIPCMCQFTLMKLSEYQCMKIEHTHIFYVRHLSLRFTATFLQKEWQHIVDAHLISSYLLFRRTAFKNATVNKCLDSSVEFYIMSKQLHVRQNTIELINDIYQQNMVQEHPLNQKMINPEKYRFTMGTNLFIIVLYVEFCWKLK